MKTRLVVLGLLAVVALTSITAEEATKLVVAEKNPEVRAFLELLWHVGAAQADLAALTTDNVDWNNRTISYYRKKTGALAIQRFGKAVEAILKRLTRRCSEPPPRLPHDICFQS